MIATTYKRTYSEDWDFRYSDTKEYTHSYHTYPAMMIPQIARKLIEDYAPDFGVNVIFDPYMGSGTTLVESKTKGINCIGTDINPLARFMSTVKTTNFNIKLITEIRENLLIEIDKYIPNYDFNLENVTNIEFWYNKDRVSELVFLENIINKLDVTVKDFFLIALSECIREVSYTRNSEFKRYKIAADKIQDFNPNTFSIFLKKINRNIKGLEELNS